MAHTTDFQRGRPLLITTRLIRYLNRNGVDHADGDGPPIAHSNAWTRLTAHSMSGNPSLRYFEEFCEVFAIRERPCPSRRVRDSDYEYSHYRLIFIPSSPWWTPPKNTKPHSNGHNAPGDSVQPKRKPVVVPVVKTSWHGELAAENVNRWHLLRVDGDDVAQVWGIKPVVRADLRDEFAGLGTHTVQAANTRSTASPPPRTGRTTTRLVTTRPLWSSRIDTTTPPNQAKPRQATPVKARVQRSGG